MSFTFRAYFSGVCAIAPNDEITKATQLCVLMPNSGRHDEPWEESRNPSLDGRYLRRHVAFLKFNLADLQTSSNVPDLAEGVWYLRRERISCRFEFEESQNMASESPILQVVYNDRPGPSNQIDLESLHWVPELERILTPELCQIDPDLFLQQEPSDKITAQVVIDHGRVGVEDLAQAEWKFWPKINPQTYQQFLAHKFFSEVTNVKKMWIRTQPLDSDGPVEEQEFRAANGQTIEMSFFTACEKNPLDWQGVALGQLNTDPDFKWHYQLLTSECQEAIKDELRRRSRRRQSGLRELPIPKRVNRDENETELGQDNNCIDTRLPPANFSF